MTLKGIDVLIKRYLLLWACLKKRYGDGVMGSPNSDHGNNVRNVNSDGSFGNNNANNANNGLRPALIGLA